ncbi:hypothetical protein AVEN_200035-1 [Araneus ventricosus]|uniref:Uncharacterized protein n=1 Tax=Araneus ventricosus TaxID=182803 RepID=A0A4Y2BFD5_ARAVE|nr:hypothetical protein AVEN_200035-1 [Araneus ventricosus]
MSSSASNGNLQDGKLLPFEMDHLPEFFLKKSEIELNETPEDKREKMQELKTMIAGQILNGIYERLELYVVSCHRNDMEQKRNIH